MRLSRLLSTNLTILTFLFLFACKDDPTLIGVNLLPPGDKLYVYDDSIEVPSANVYLNDPLPSDDFLILGEYNDQFFGPMKASFITEIRPFSIIKKYNIKKIDAAYIVLNLYDFGGGIGWKDFTRLKVSKLKKPLTKPYVFSRDIDINQYIDNNSVLVDTSVDLAGYPDSLTLPNSFAEKILALDSITFTNDTLFRTAMQNMQYYGLYFSVDLTRGPGAMASFDMASRDVYGYLKNHIFITFETTTDTLVHQLLLGFSSYTFDKSTSSYDKYYYPKLNYITHDYSKTKFFSELNGGLQDTLLYTQNGNGVKIKIDLSELKRLRSNDKNVQFSVGRADLVLPFEYSMYDRTIPLTTSRMPISNQLVLRVMQNDSLVPFKNFFKPNTDVFVNGYVNVSGRYCYLNLSQYVQDYLNNKTNIDAIYLQPFSTSLSSAIFKRVKNLKLEISYSKFKNNQ
jgi:hypothetical protein